MPADQRVVDAVRAELSLPGAALTPDAIPNVNPDTLSRSLKVARNNGGSPLTLADDPLGLDRSERSDAMARLAEQAPKAAGVMAMNPIAAALAKDDMDNVSMMEQAISALHSWSFSIDRVKEYRKQNPSDYNSRLFYGGTKPLVTDADFAVRAEKMFASGLFATKQEAADAVRHQISGFVQPGESMAAPGKASMATLGGTADWLGGVLPQQLGSAWRGISRNVGDILGMSSAADQIARQDEKARAQAALIRPDFGGSTANAVASGVESTIQQAPAIVAGIASGGAAPTLGYLGAMTYGQNYGKYKDRGGSIVQSMLGAGGEAVVEVAAEKLPMGDTLRALESATGGRWKQAAASALSSQMKEIPGEQVATILQDAIDTAVANPKKTWAEYMVDRPDAAYQTLVATVTQGALMTGGLGLVRGTGRLGYVPPEQKKSDAEAAAQFLEQVNKASAASKVLARDPETFLQFVKAAAEDGPVTDVYIDAQVLNQSGLADAVLAASPTAAEYYQDALATGGQVRIPIDEYAARIAPQEYAQQLIDDIRLRPEDMTRREADEFAKSGGMAELEQAMTRIIGDKATDDAFTASRERVKQQVLDNLNTLGRFTPQKNELDATLIAARSATRAAQLGLTPEEFFNQYLLKVTAEKMGGDTLNQFAGANALTADTGQLAKAQERVAAGEDAEKVRQETGWHTGADGKWRFEISDADAKLTPAIESLYRGGNVAADIESVTYRKNEDGTYNVSMKHAGAKSTTDFAELNSVPEEVARAVLPDDVFSAMQRGDGEADFIGGNLDDAKTIKTPFRFEGMNALPLDMVIDHPALFAAYPALRQVMVKVDPKAGIGGSLGEMEDGTFVITVGNGQQKGTMLHEIQHAIQENEGFATGGSLDSVTVFDEKPLTDARMIRRIAAKEGIDVGEAAVKFMEMMGREPEGNAMTLVREMTDEELRNAESSPMQAYKRLAGEVEARNTQARADMNEAERNATSPQSTADVAERDQIVTFSKGLAEMVNDKPAGAEIAEAQRQLEEQLAIADRMIAERGGLFAPNGEPSKLNRYQWAQVRTANFKRWFGDWESDPDGASKVVDANGEPMVVYRYAKNEDEISGGVRFFTKNADYAEAYFEEAGNGAGVTAPAYLNLKNPLIANMEDRDFSDPAKEAPYIKTAIDGPQDGVIFKQSSGADEFYAALDAASIKSATGNAGTFSGETDNILYQPDGGPGPVKRGSFSPATNTIALLKNADLSTFLHETGHYFFETDIAIAREILRENAAFGVDTQKPGQQQILRDVSALLKWHGIEGDIASQVDQWERMDFEERRTYHEKTAESFERYLLEGKAPSIELQSVFQTFRQWLLSVYKSLKAFLAKHPDAGELNPEVRAVFDRMLATEEEIKLAEQARGMLPLFADAMNAGMTPAEFAEYQKLGNEATQAAIDELQAKGVKDMKWLANARSRMLKKLQKQAKAQRAEVRAGARMDVLQEPVYQAWNLLTSKMTEEDKLAGRKPKKNDSVDPAVDSLFEAIAKLGGLNKEAVIAQWGVDPKDKAESGIFSKPVLRAKDGGRSMDWMVEALTEEGYLAPDENGKGDIIDLEERFKAELRGDRQYSSIRNWEPEPLPGQGEDLGGITAARIDRASLDDMEGLPQEVIDRLESLGMTARSGGIHPDVLSEILPGWTSGDELVRALVKANPLKDEIEARTDQLMLEQYSELATPEAIEQAADMAIHNDARERFLLAEHKALVKASGDKSQRQIMLTAAKDYARQLIGRQRIRDIRPAQYTAAEARAAKAAMTTKDIAQKAAEKRNQILSGMAAREAYRAREDVEKALRYLKKFDSPTIRRRVNSDYVDQIEALLEKVDLRKHSLKDIDRRKSFGAFVRAQIDKGIVPTMSDSLLPPNLRSAYLAKVMERNEDGELLVRDDVEQAKILADFLDMAETRSYKDMSVEEFRGMIESIRQIEHLGRKKKSLLTARDGATYEQKRDELTASVTANSEQLPDRLNRTVPNDRDEKLRGMRDFRISLRKIGMIMRLLDGNKDGGPMWDFFVRSANERGDWETNMISQATEALTKALRPVFALGKMRGKGVYFESIGRSLNREQRIGLALNVGNDGNLQRLLDGEGWTYEDIRPVLESLTESEWNAVQSVWDHMDSYRPMIAAIERRTVGMEPDWVQPVQFTVTTADGKTLTLKGGYFPVKYDIEASQRAEQLNDATDAKRAMDAANNSSTTHRSFVKKRSEAVVGRPVELSLSAMYSGVQDVIHDLAWREWLIDASKMVSSSTLDDAIRRKHGGETVRAIRQWVQDIAAGTRQPRRAMDSAAAFMRRKVSAAGLAINVMNAVQNVTGIQNSIERVGAKWMAIGQKEYLSGPVEAAKWVNEKSSFMANRARTLFRDLNELRNIVENGDGLITKAQQNQYILMTVTQRIVDTPTWIGAYRKAEAEGAVIQLEDGTIDDSKAIAMADQAVIDAQGSGMIKDLSAIERGGEVAKLFTVFYSYMGTTYNLAANRIAGARGGDMRQKGAAAFHVLVLISVPTTIMMILRSALTPGDDDELDDPEKAAKNMMRNNLSFALGMIPMAREFMPVADSFLSDKSFGYQGPSGMRMVNDATKLSQQARQGEFDEGFRKAAVNFAGVMLGLPSTQINRTWTGADALADDKTDNPAALLFGYDGK